jgi:hypothetical protein
VPSHAPSSPASCISLRNAPRLPGTVA